MKRRYSYGHWATTTNVPAAKRARKNVRQAEDIDISSIKVNDLRHWNQLQQTNVTNWLFTYTLKKGINVSLLGAHLAIDFYVVHGEKTKIVFLFLFPLYS